jgi:translation initiation factor IF-3
MDYGKFKYGRQRHKGGPKHHHVSKLKELQLRPSTHAHDVEIRVNQARKFLERGDRVLVTIIFKGRELAHMELGKKVCAHFATALQDIAKVEKEPNIDGRRMGMILVHHKS